MIARILQTLATELKSLCRRPRLVVAAHNSPDKEAAKYVCTGTDDEVVIQEAVDNAQSFSPYPPPIHFCSGTYNLRDPVWCGYDFKNHHGDPFDLTDPDTPGGRVCPPDISGTSRTWLHWRDADNPDRYMMVYNARHSTRAFLGGLSLNGRGVARGLLVLRNRYGGYMHDIRAHDTLHVGLDFVDCWGSSGDRLLAFNGRGYGIRITNWNGGSLCDLLINSGRGHEADDYPSDPDYVKDYTGKVAYPAGCEAALFIDGGSGTVTDIQIENNDYRTYPTVRISADSKTFTGFRFEGGYDPGGGDRGIMKQSDYGIIIENCYGVALNDAAIGTRYCYDKEVPKEEWTMVNGVYLKRCQNCVVRNVAGKGVRNAIVRVGADCEDIGVERCYDRSRSRPGVVKIDDGAKRTTVDWQPRYARDGEGERVMAKQGEARSDLLAAANERADDAEAECDRLKAYIGICEDCGKPLTIVDTVCRPCQDEWEREAMPEGRL